MTMITVIALCTVLGANPEDTPKEPQPSVSETLHEGQSLKEVSKNQTISISFGVSDMPAKEIYWFGGKERSVVALDYRLDAEELFPGFSYGFSASHEQSEGDFDFSFSEVSLNALYQWPNEGLVGIAFPYVRVSVLSAMVLVQSNTPDRWSDNNFVPGIAGAIGATIGIGRRDSVNQLHWIAIAECEYAARATTLIRLRPTEGERAMEPVRIGDVNLSGMAIRMGIGFEF